MLEYRIRVRTKTEDVCHRCVTQGDRLAPKKLYYALPKSIRRSNGKHCLFVLPALLHSPKRNCLIPTTVSVHPNHNPIDFIPKKNKHDNNNLNWYMFCLHFRCISFAGQITSKSGLAAFLLVIATIATDKFTRSAYANESARNSKNACKCRTPKIEVAARREREKERNGIELRCRSNMSIVISVVNYTEAINSILKWITIRCFGYFIRRVHFCYQTFLWEAIKGIAKTMLWAKFASNINRVDSWDEQNSCCST